MMDGLGLEQRACSAHRCEICFLSYQRRERERRERARASATERRAESARNIDVSEYDPERSNRALRDPDRGWDRHLGGWRGRRLTTLSASGYEGQPVFKGLYGSNNIGM